MKYVYLLILVSLFLVGCTEEKTTVVVPQETDNTVPTEPIIPPVNTVTSSSGYNGEVLAGDKTPYIVFNTVDYAKATADGKVILLYFYSDINTNCKADELKIFKAFDDMENTKMIGFKVHFGDTLVTDAEKQLATSLGVKDSRTKVILKDGVIKQKSSTTWDISTYAAQMSLYLT